MTGSVLKPTTDGAQIDLWETCNNMASAWLTGNVSPNIKKSVMFMPTAKQIWLIVKKLFSLTNGSRKYKLDKPNVLSISRNSLIESYLGEIRCNEYFTCCCSYHRSYYSVRYYLSSKGESKLFQFLNGLKETYSSQRNRLLMMSPLLTVEAAFILIQQEEVQRELLNTTKVGLDGLAMYSKFNLDKQTTCSACGVKGRRCE